MPSLRVVRAALLLLAASLLSAQAWANDEALWALLQRGGNVVVVRHALTTPGVGDPEGMKLDDCASQRNLSDPGWAEARRLGQALQRRGIRFERVLSSRWCRCLETARLATGRDPEVEPALGNLFGQHEREAQQLARLRPLAARVPARGNVLMVTHGSTTVALTGVSPATAEMVILTPRGDGFVVAGRLQAQP
ncbi:MAG: histidine phosphatase family protein [Pseudomonadota bacterium]